jgi:hypothetical protein
MNQIMISETGIKQDEQGRYCLNDLHRAAGGEKRHQPSNWLANKQTSELIAELSITGITGIETKQGLGTFVAKELVYSYAMWISPAFNLKVIRTFDAQANPLPALNDPAALRTLLLGYTEKVLQLEAEKAEMQPKADFFDAVTGSATAVDMAIVAKTLNGFSTAAGFIACCYDLLSVVRRILDDSCIICEN